MQTSVKKNAAKTYMKNSLRIIIIITIIIIIIIMIIWTNYVKAKINKT